MGQQPFSIHANDQRELKQNVFLFWLLTSGMLLLTVTAFPLSIICFCKIKGTFPKFGQSTIKFCKRFYSMVLNT